MTREQGVADIEIRARAFWTDVEGAEHAVGFAASEDPEDGYVIFEGRPGDRKGLYLEVSDDIFAAKDAVETVVFGAEGFTLTDPAGDGGEAGHGGRGCCRCEGG
jgi:hypothetical protein